MRYFFFILMSGLTSTLAAESYRLFDVVRGPASIPIQLSVSPEGRHVYAASVLETTWWQRNESTGVLTFGGAEREPLELQNIERSRAAELAFSPNGNQLYALRSDFENAVLVVFDRDAQSGALTAIQRLQFLPNLRLGALAVDPAGRNVYVGGTQILTLSRNATDGTLTLLPGGLDVVGSTGLLVSPAGNLVFHSGDEKIRSFARESTSGALTLIDTLDSFEREQIVGTGKLFDGSLHGDLFYGHVVLKRPFFSADALAAVSFDGSGQLTLESLPPLLGSDTLVGGVDVDPGTGRVVFSWFDTNGFQAHTRLLEPLSDGLDFVQVDDLGPFLPFQTDPAVGTPAFSFDGRQVYVGRFFRRHIAVISIDNAGPTLGDPEPGQGLARPLDLEALGDGSVLVRGAQNLSLLDRRGAGMFEAQWIANPAGIQASFSTTPDDRFAYTSADFFGRTRFDRQPDGTFEAVLSQGPLDAEVQAMSPDGRHLLTWNLSEDLQVFQVDPMTGDVTLIPGSSRDPGAPVRSLAFSPDGGSFYAVFTESVSGADALGFGFDSQTGMIGAAGQGVPTVEALAFEPGGEHLYSVGSTTQGEVTLNSYEVSGTSTTEIDTEVLSVGKPDPDPGTAIAIARDGSRVFVYDGAGSLYTLSRHPADGQLTLTSTLQHSLTQDWLAPPNGIFSLVTGPNALYALNGGAGTLAILRDDFLFADGFESGDTSRWQP